MTGSMRTNSGKNATSQPIIHVPLLERAALTPREFAAVFGRKFLWGYRQIYAGRVKTIKSLGWVLIPRSEVDRLLAEAKSV